MIRMSPSFFYDLSSCASSASVRYGIQREPLHTYSDSSPPFCRGKMAFKHKTMSRFKNAVTVALLAMSETSQIQITLELLASSPPLQRTHIQQVLHTLPSKLSNIPLDPISQQTITPSQPLCPFINSYRLTKPSNL